MKVLLIEPVTELRVMLRGVLKAMGITDLAEPRTSLEGMHYLLSGNYDLFLFSQDTEPFNGFMSMKIIRNCKEDNIRQLRAIMTSGLQDEETEKKAYDLGVDTFLRKPFSADDVRAAINHLISYRAAFLESPSYTGPCRRKWDSLKEGEYDRRDPMFNPGPGDYKLTLSQIVQRILNVRDKKAKSQLSEREKELAARGGIILDDIEEEYRTHDGLRPGMIITKPISTEGGMLVLPAMSTINLAAIRRLGDLMQARKLSDGFWVQKGVIKNLADAMID